MNVSLTLDYETKAKLMDLTVKAGCSSDRFVSTIVAAFLNSTTAAEIVDELTRRGARREPGAKFTGTELRIIQLLEHASLSCPTLATTAGRSHVAVTRALGDLVIAGMVSRSVDPNYSTNGRAGRPPYLYTITDAGREALKASTGGAQ